LAETQRQSSLKPRRNNKDDISKGTRKVSLLDVGVDSTNKSRNLKNKTMATAF
jgi:hypothetical protein